MFHSDFFHLVYLVASQGLEALCWVLPGQQPGERDAASRVWHLGAGPETAFIWAYDLK